MQIDIKTTLKGFKWIQLLFVYFLLASSCFSAENNNSLLVQSKVEYWLEKFGKCEKEGKIFSLWIEQGISNQNKKEYQEALLSLVKAIKSNPSSLTAIQIVVNIREAVPEREEKNISKQKFLFETLFEAISHNNKIERVDFFSEGVFNRKISHEVSTLFFKMLKENKTIELLSLNQCTFDERDILELAELLRNNKTIVEFDLRGLENLTIKGEKALLQALTDNKSTKIVNLFPVSSESNDAYFTLISENKSLATYLNKFEFNKEAELTFAKVISSNTDSKASWSSHDSFSLEGKKALLKALIHNNSHKSLIFFSFVPRKLNEAFCELIRKNKTLEKIQIGKCNFNEEEVLKLAKAIGENTTIKEIDLEGLGHYLTLKGKNALREVEEERTKTSWFSFKKKEPLVVLLPNIPDQYLNQNIGR